MKIIYFVIFCSIWCLKIFYTSIRGYCINLILKYLLQIVYCFWKKKQKAILIKNSAYKWIIKNFNILNNIWIKKKYIYLNNLKNIKIKKRLL